ncbi:hemolysin-III related-domain-containing protein [Cladorrhinum samala]|uniref:Hemolysin-III related-domain-containing protein n=1 Tax=Cladorrhinum samala TaxID=585594 RepID=A0AAV9HIW3_9PEZI|nr:hemolysin-III related-domain-containing protein [Cladorrhinum samala]
MALYKRSTPVGNRREESESLLGHNHIGNHTHKDADKYPKFGRQLLDASEVPDWYAHNTYLLSGYRPVTGSARFCFESLVGLHNETVNIWSHLLPGMIAVAGNCYLHLYFARYYPASLLADRLAIHVYLTSSVICFGMSSLYHTLNCHSQAYSDLWARWDYAAIILQTVGSFTSGVYVTFYHHRGLQNLYWAMTLIGGLMSVIVVVNPKFQSSKWRALRISTFVTMGLSGLLPIIHAAAIYPWALLNEKAGLGYYLVEGLSLVTGTVFYATQFPESWAPRKFDILGASHQLFHGFVVLAATIHIYGLLSVYDWIYKNPQI